MAPLTDTNSAQRRQFRACFGACGCLRLANRRLPTRAKDGIQQGKSLAVVFQDLLIKDWHGKILFLD